jgi:hypothetical protein
MIDGNDKFLKKFSLPRHGIDTENLFNIGRKRLKYE